MFELGRNNTIRLTRGDTCYIDVEVLGNYELQEGDVLHFSVKKRAKDADYAFHIALPAQTILVINPSDTKDLDCGRYYYDIQLNTVDGEVFTLLGPCEFRLLEEITRE